MTTPGGLPYPDSTDDFNQGANDIKALALALSARGLDKFVQSATVTVHFDGANGTLVYPVPFADTGVKPILVASGNVANVIVFLAIGSPNFNACGMTLMQLWPAPVDIRTTPTDVAVSFIAIGPK